MKGLPLKEIKRLQNLLLEDERKRDHNLYVYSNDIIVVNCVVPFSIWPMPNSDISEIMKGKLYFDDIICENQNELEKERLFKDFCNFIVQYKKNGVDMLCEVMDYKNCSKGQCRLFRLERTKVGGKHGVCSEFKIAFAKQSMSSRFSLGGGSKKNKEKVMVA